jgi:hypothetical protein
MRMRLIVICGLSGYTTFFQIISYTARFLGEKLLGKELCFLSTTFAWNISHSKKNLARQTQVLTQSARYSRHSLMKLVFSRQIWATQSLCVYQINTRFHFLNDTTPRIFVYSFIYCDMFRQSFRPLYDPGVDTVSNRNDDQECFLRGKCGQCVGLTTLPPSRAECLEIWEPQPPETLGGCPGLYRYSFTLTTVIIKQFRN